MRQAFWRLMAAAIVSLIVAAGPAQAGDKAIEAFQSAAYSGKISRGIANLETMASADAGDMEALFGLGVLRFFGAIVDLQQGLYRHSTKITGQGKGSSLTRGLLPRGLGNTMLVPPNPNATPMTYAKLRELVAEFAAKLGEAERTLARIGDRAVKLPLRPFDIAVDLNHNGSIESNERVLVSLLRGQRTRVREAAFGAELAFDTADASWLRGYANLLMASANFMLAFDFEKSYNVAAHNLYGDKATAFGNFVAQQAGLGRKREVIQAEYDSVSAKIKELRRERSSRRDIRDLEKHLRELPLTPENAEHRQLYEDALKTMQANRKGHRERLAKLYREQRRLRAERDGGAAGWIYDAVAFIHTLSWDVAEPRRLSAARKHLLQVMAINRNTWRLARLETDDDREWLPNAKQTAPFGSKPITDKVIDSWLATTALAAEVLRGEKLLPHPRFRKGLNLRKFLDGAKRLDFVLIATGHDLVPHLEDGPVVDEKAWSAITQPMGRHVGQYAIWFN
jgi:hypothetical protein